MTFDLENVADPMRGGFRALESLNEANLAPGGSLSPPGLHENAEILTYVRTGALTHQDVSGRLCRMGAGEFLRTSARRGTDHRQLSGSPGDHTQIFQSRITPDRKSRKRGEQKRFAVAERRGILRLIASPNGRDGSLHIHQDVRIYSSLVDPGTHLIHELGAGRNAWLHVVKGPILLVDHCLRAGDGAALMGEAAVSLTAQEASEILLFDLA